MKVYELIIDGYNKGLYLRKENCLKQVKEYYGILFNNKNLYHIEDGESEIWHNFSKNQDKGGCMITTREVQD